MMIIMDEKLLLLPFLLLFLCFLHVVVPQSSPDNDFGILESLRVSWQIQNWVGSDPCSSQWQGIQCSNSRVVSMSLTGSGLNGQLPAAIGFLSELDTLDLSYNKNLTGSLPKEIGNLKKLTKLVLVDCGFTGSIPDEIGSLQNLVFLSLNSNNFTGKIPSSIGNLENLNWLDLTDNQLDGPIPVSPGLDLLHKAMHFHLGKNKLNGTIPSELFSSETTLIHLILDSNQLNGIIPDTLGLVKSLTVVRLENNLLSGNVPQNLNNLTNVTDLILHNNKLTGPLPNLNGMCNLSYLDLSNNTFDRSDFPPWLSTLNRLVTLLMESVNLSGNIPASLFSLPILQNVVLKNNHLNGTLDIGSNYSRKLQSIYLQKNSIESFKQQNDQLNFQIILANNPFCDENEASKTYCTVPPPIIVNTEIPRSCSTAACSSDQIPSPKCKCSYPYTGTLTFRAPSCFFWRNTSSIEHDLKDVFQWNHLTVDLVVSSLNGDPFQDFTFLIQIFPLDRDRFNHPEIHHITLALSNFSANSPCDFTPDEIYAFYQQNSHHSSNNAIIIGATVGGSSVLVLLLVLAGFYAFHQRKRAERAISRNNPFGNWDPNKSNCGMPQISAAKQYSFKDLKKCTNNFSQANDIGSGGYGKVYKGTLPCGQLIAIKRAQKESKQGGLEFKAEIELLSRVHHKNLVSLLGFCFEQGEQMLVYEFVPNGTLKDTISGKSGIILSWKRRIKVALGAARGLAYLHEHANPPIIHRDIKSNNILLDETLDAKVADFGLSKPLLDCGKDHVTTQVKGTLGYLDPEYYTSQQLTEKSDVYSFGVLMLELITGRKPIERGKYIVKVVRSSIDKTKDLYGLHELIDRAINSGSKLTGFVKFVDLAMMCLEESGAERPAMSDVVKEIELILHAAGLDPSSESTETTSTSFIHNEVCTESSHNINSNESLYSSAEHLRSSKEID